MPADHCPVLIGQLAHFVEHTVVYGDFADVMQDGGILDMLHGRSGKFHILGDSLGPEGDPVQMPMCIWVRLLHNAPQQIHSLLVGRQRPLVRYHRHPQCINRHDDKSDAQPPVLVVEQGGQQSDWGHENGAGQHPAHVVMPDDVPALCFVGTDQCRND